MSAAKGERFAPPEGRNYYGHSMHAFRSAHGMTGHIATHARTNQAERQEVADGMATITETATVGPRDINGKYLVTFTVTHRILPIDPKEQNA